MAKDIQFNGKELDANTTNAIAGNVLVEGQRPITWWRQQGTDLHNKFMREMRTSLENGESTAQAATRIAGGTIKGVEVPGIMNTAKNNANTLARTAINKVTNEARIQSFEANADVVKAMKQISTLDNRTSQICIAYDGQVWENAPGNKPVPPSTLPFNGGPPRHFNCRSTLVPVLKSWEELGIPADELSASTRASMDGQVPDDTTFDDFLKSKGTAFQDDILGPTKAKLWRAGKITLQQLVNFRGDPLTTEQLLKVAKKKRPVAKPKPKPAAKPAAKPKPKPAPKEAPRGPYQKAGDLFIANEWHRTSWNNAPDYVRDALDDVPVLTGVTKQGKGAFYNPKTYSDADHASINMSKQHTFDRKLSQGTWRHEYGHHLDYTYARRLPEKKFLDSKRQISWSAPMRDLFKSDLDSVLAKAGKTRPTRVKQLDKAAAIFDDHLKKTMDGGTDYLDKQFKKRGTSYAEMRAIHRNNMDQSVDAPNDAIMRNKMAHLLTAMDTQNVNYYIINVWEGQQFYHSGINGKILDYYGSLTKNKVGQGHSTAYYSEGPQWQSTEMFANAVTMLGDEPGWSKVVRNLGHHEFYDGVEKLLKNKGVQ